MAFDPEDGLLDGNKLKWQVDGVAASGFGAAMDASSTAQPLSSTNERIPPSPGEHTIRLLAQDSDGNDASDSVTIVIVADADRDKLEQACGSDPTNAASRCTSQTYAAKFVCGDGRGRLAAQTPSGSRR